MTVSTRLPNGLTEIQNKFVEIYLSDPSRNASQAAIKAGYSSKYPNQTATQLLHNKKIIKILAENRAKLSVKLDVKREHILRGLLKIFESSDSDKNKIAAANEINKMCGFNAPEKHQHELNAHISTVLLLPDNGR